MNKSLLKRIASVATELDQSGFTREAKDLDLILLKLAQEEMDDYSKAYFEKNPDAPRTYEEAYFEKYPDAPRGRDERKMYDTGMDDYSKAYFQKYPKTRDTQPFDALQDTGMDDSKLDESLFQMALEELVKIDPAIRTLPRHLQELSAEEYLKSKRRKQMRSDLPPHLDQLSMEEFMKSPRAGKQMRSDLPPHLDQLSMEEFMKSPRAKY